MWELNTSTFFVRKNMIKQICIQYYKTKIGELIIGSFQEQLCLLDYRYRRMRKSIDNRLKRALNCDFVEIETDTITKTKLQLDEYLLASRKIFTIPLLMIGTDFQKKVWNKLQEIQYGTTISYKELAIEVGNEKAFRAVASANGQNSIGIIIPCHRVIQSNGELGGFAGGLFIKKRILKMEENNRE